MYTNKF